MIAHMISVSLCNLFHGCLMSPGYMFTLAHGMQETERLSCTFSVSFCSLIFAQEKENFPPGEMASRLVHRNQQCASHIHRQMCNNRHPGDGNILLV